MSSEDNEWKAYQVTFQDKDQNVLFNKDGVTCGVITLGRSQEEAIGYAFTRFEQWKYEDSPLPDPQYAAARELQIDIDPPRGLELVLRKKEN